jgi:hypothetical protein
MEPVTRALQTIATIQSETREVHAPVASPSESVLSHNLSISSLAPYDRDGRISPSCPKSNATADVNIGSGAQPIANVNTTAEDSTWDREIRIGKEDRVVVAPALETKRRPRAIIIAGALLLAISLGLGWFAPLSSLSFSLNSASPPPVREAASAPAKLDPAPINPPVSARAQETSKSRTQTTVASLPAKQNTGPTAPTAVERTKVSARPTSVPETRPATIEGWTVREINGGTAVLEGPKGVWKAARGDTVPGLGTIDSIVRWGNRWIVATSRGLISTR